MTQEKDYLRLGSIQRIARAIDNHITALRLIPEYDANDFTRSMHLKHLESAISEMRGLLK